MLSPAHFLGMEQAMLAKRTTVPVTMRALIQRINRRLKADGEMLKTARGRAAFSVGQYYICNPQRNWIVKERVDPEALGRELGVLAAWERVEDGD
jgi:hypothetical protein